MDSLPAARICTVTLNPAVDVTAGIDGFRPGRVNRVAWERADPGGKGVNVAGALVAFGASVTATGLLGLENAAPLTAFLADRGIPDRFIRLPGRTRTNIKLIDEAARGEAAVTDLNFPGPTATPEALAALDAALDELAADHEWFVLSGAVPQGAPEDLYARLTERLKGRGRKVVIDASGPALRHAVDAGPALVKPNLHELRDLVGPVDGDPLEVAAAARDLMDRGVGAVVVSLAEAGAVFVDGGGRAVFAEPPDVEVVSTVGAGDAMVAGLVIGFLRSLKLADRARLATACSAAALTTLGPRLPEVAVVEGLMREVVVTSLD